MAERERLAARRGATRRAGWSGLLAGVFLAALAAAGLLAQGPWTEGSEAAVGGGRFAGERLPPRLPPRLPLEVILDKARAVRPGRVLGVEVEDGAQGPLYEVELLDPQGRMWELFFDARTGEQVPRPPESPRHHERDRAKGAAR